MSDRKTFEYGGYHFTPIRKFHKKEGDFFAISKRLASDPNLGLCTYQDRQKAPYDYKGFYTVATDKECDVFRCEENGLLYVPGENELFICRKWIGAGNNVPDKGTTIKVTYWEDKPSKARIEL